MTLCFAIAAIALACAPCALAARAGNLDPKQELGEAQRAGWAAARSAVDGLRRTGRQPRNAGSPATAAWIADFDEMSAKIGTSGPPSRWRELDINALVVANPRFWQAAGEAVPANPALMMVHAALLLAAGEATRSRYVIVLAAQHPGLPAEWRERYRSLFASADAAGRRSRELVREGVALRSRQDFPGALEKIADALIRWPQNASAHREIARTLREQAWEASRNLDQPDSPEVSAAFERARSHDPLLLEAYQTSDPAQRKILMALLATKGTAWLRSNQNPDRPVETETLARLAVALQRAGLDELAQAADLAVHARRVDPVR